MINKFGFGAAVQLNDQICPWRVGDLIITDHPTGRGGHRGGRVEVLLGGNVE